MRVVILGAGDIGAAVARQLAATSLVRHVVLVDAAASVAAGKALDIAQAGPVERYDTRVTGTDDETAVAGATAVVLADQHGAPAREWADETGLTLLRRVARLCGDAPIACAGVGQATLVERGVHELGLPRTRLFGTAPEALRAAIVSLVALEAETTPAEVSLVVVGYAPHAVIVPWQSASISGRPAVDVLSTAALTRLDHRAVRLWPPGAMTLGAATARVVASMATRAPRAHVLHVAVAGGDGHSGVSAMLPARVGPNGVVRLESLPLSTRDRVRLDTVLAR